MLTRTELDERSRAMDTEYAIRSMQIRNKLDREYSSFVFMGTDETRAEVSKQWELAKVVRLQKELNELRQQLEIATYGIDGFEGAMKRIKAMEKPNSSLIIF